MSDYLLMIYPALITIILLFGGRISKKGEFNTDSWSISQSKAMQVFAALMIILHHVVQSVTGYGGVKKGLITEWNSFGILFTSIFFFFSGFGLYKSYKNKDNYLDGFLKKRLLKVILPFVFTNIIYILVLSKDVINDPKLLFTSIFGYPLVNINAWFMIVIIILYIAFYMCFKTSKSDNAAILKLTVFTCALVAYSLTLGHSNIKGHWFTGEWWYNTTLIFIIGFLWAKHEEVLKALLKKIYAVLFPALIIIFYIWYGYTGYILGRYGYYREWEGHPGYREKFISLVAQMVLCMLYVMIMLLLNIKIEYKNKALGFLGKMTYEIYLIHELFRELLLKGIGGKMLNDMTYIALVYIFSIISAWVICLLYKFLKNLKNRVIEKYNKNNYY